MYFKSLNGKLLSDYPCMDIILYADIHCKRISSYFFKGGGFPGEKPIVFVAGEVWNGSFYVAKYWVDGQEVVLSDGTGSAITSSIFVSNNDVYIAGSDYKEFGGAVYWKNNSEIQLAVGGMASSIFVSGNDAYVAGNVGDDPVYWKNGTQVDLVRTNVYGIFGSATANSIFVSGNDIYVAGNDGPNAVYWKNGEEKYLTTKNSSVGGNYVANSIYVSGADVYIAGYIIVAVPQFPQIWYWKNDVLFPVNKTDSFGQASSIFISGGNVYLAGAKISDPTNGIETAASLSRMGIP